jgi:hypothetical protein
LLHGASNSGLILPTRPRLREGTDLLTCGSENDREKAGDEKATRAVFNGGGGGVRRCSGSKICSSGGGACGGSSKR